MSKPYSVLLLYPDYIAESYGQETFYAHVRGDSAADAVCNAQKEAAAMNAVYFTDGDDPADFHPLLVLAGHHRGEMLP